MTDITLPREPTPEMLTKMARAICGDGDWGWYFRRQISRKPFYDKARAAYAALVEHLEGEGE